jgi:DNA-binding CsgD family transcriptional regulator
VRRHADREGESIREGLRDDFPTFFTPALTERQAEVLAMREGRTFALSYSEIGRFLGISKQAAWRLHRRALGVLGRHYVDIHGHTPGGGG